MFEQLGEKTELKSSETMDIGRGPNFDVLYCTSATESKFNNLKKTSGDTHKLDLHAKFQLSTTLTAFKKSGYKKKTRTRKNEEYI